MEITLSEKQLQLIQAAVQEQQTLQVNAQNEFNKIQKRLDDIVEVILDSHSVAAVPGIKLEDGKLIVPDAQEQPKEE